MLDIFTDVFLKAFLVILLLQDFNCPLHAVVPSHGIIVIPRKDGFLKGYIVGYPHFTRPPEDATRINLLAWLALRRPGPLPSRQRLKPRVGHIPGL